MDDVEEQQGTRRGVSFGELGDALGLLSPRGPLLRVASISPQLSTRLELWILQLCVLGIHSRY